MRKSLIQWLGLLGIISLLSYLVAVLFAPIAYPGYDWLRQAVSDLSAMDSPARQLWNQLSSLHGVCGVVSITLVCIFIKDKMNMTTRIGIYLFGMMQWISYLGYSMFPLTSSGYQGTTQDFIHTYIITALVVLLSIVSLAFIITGTITNKVYRSLGIWAMLTVVFMILGAIGVGVAPASLFGLFERFSVFSSTGFNTILGIYLFIGFQFKKEMYY